MIFDRLAEFCDATAVSQAGTGTYALGSNYDLGAANKDPGAGQPLYLVITVDTAFTSGDSATVQFQLVSDSQDPPAADGTETIHIETQDFPVATLVQGYTIVHPLPSGDLDYERYIGIQAIVGTAALTAGKINAFLTMDGAAWRAYADGTR